MNEKQWIEYLKKHVSCFEDVIGIGDDSAVLPDGTLISTDTFVEEIHFSRKWASWRLIGRKACEAAISDIAAMGGKPLWLLANLSSSESGGVADELLHGILECGIPLIGGDTTSSQKGAVTLTLTVLGKTERPVLRSGAKTGDRIFVSGKLGGTQAGLLSLQKGLNLFECEKRFLEPRARLDISESWGALATSMIDVSDGLSTELNHLSEASKKRFRIDISKLPCFSEIEKTGREATELILESGEEFELLATSNFNLPGGFEIGVVEDGHGVYDGLNEILPRGYDHWS